MQVTIAQSNINAVAYAMAKADIRYYLCGMLLQHNGEETRLVATDGHRLHAVRIEHKDGLTIDPVEVIIPDTLIRTICKAKASRNNKLPTVTITVDGNRISVLLPDGTESVATAIDGKFPDYSRVIPDSFNGECAQYNPEYVSDCYSAVRDYFRTKNAYAYFNHNGDGVGGIAVDGFMAIVMPWRADKCAEGMGAMKAEMRKPSVPLPAGFEDAQAAVDYANTMQQAA